MTADVPAGPYEVEQVEDVTLVRFLRRTILDPDTIQVVGDQLLAQFAQAGGRKLVLDFAQVESLTSAMLGRLVGVHQAIAAGGGRLVFCNVGPFLLQIFTICNVPTTIPVLPDRAAAVQHLSA